MFTTMKKTVILILFLLTGHPGFAAETTIGADLIQPFILGGWNLNGYHYFDNGLVIGWSHGDNLKFSYKDSFATDPIKDSRAEVFTDWSTGPEIGYRLGKNWDARIDLKAHYNRLTFESNAQPLRYTVYTLGPSLFYNWYPFTQDTKGFVVQLSARYWFNVGDDLDNNNYTYVDKNGNTKTHDPKDYWDGSLGGFGANIAFGYTF
ncbi:MAG: hypothetical protein ACK5RO_07220 [Pseudobdellovibrionaceae bacterium]